MANRNRDIKQSLLARKEELLKELKYYEKRIDDAKNKTNSSYHDDSSESEQEFTVQLEPSIAELKLKQSTLQTCLFATQELTSVQILQSEVNIVSQPDFERETPIKEDGVWREVLVECRVDLVPFSMNFYVHKPKNLFSPLQYRNLQVNPVKSAHEQELASSVLTTVKTPSDAVEVLRNYAKAHRSRRSTLARLAESYGHTLFMEPLPEGGYILKCADLLEVSWNLQNKWSPIAPFHHKMKFDLEYMDESYIKIITQAHRQLSDPAVETDERTSLLSKIINTCLQAKKQKETVENEPDVDKNVDKTKDSEIMAPPKTIPKKNKKKLSNSDYGSTKRAKIDDKENSTNNNNDIDGNNVINNLVNDVNSVKNDKKAKADENKSKGDGKYLNDNNKARVVTKLIKNNQLKTNEVKSDEDKVKINKKDIANKKNKEVSNKKSDKEQIIKDNKLTTDKKEEINKNDKKKENVNKDNEIKSINKINKEKVNLKELKNKANDKKSKIDNKLSLETKSLKTNEELNKKNNKIENNKNNIKQNKDLNKNKINTDKEQKSVKEIKSNNNIINKEINRNKMVNKTKISGNKLNIKKQTNSIVNNNITNNSNSSNKDKNKIVSKIPKRIQSMESKKNILRLSPRFIKKPSLKPQP